MRFSRADLTRAELFFAFTSVTPQIVMSEVIAARNGDDLSKATIDVIGNSIFLVGQYVLHLLPQYQYAKSAVVM